MLSFDKTDDFYLIVPVYVLTVTKAKMDTFRTTSSPAVADDTSIMKIIHLRIRA